MTRINHEYAKQNRRKGTEHEIGIFAGMLLAALNSDGEKGWSALCKSNPDTGLAGVETAAGLSGNAMTHVFSDPWSVNTKSIKRICFFQAGMIYFSR